MTKTEVLTNLDNWINRESKYVYETPYSNEEGFRAVDAVEVYNHVKELILYYLDK